MIRSLSSNRPTFKSFRFRPGLNLIIAERIVKSRSNDQGTRNGAGKSSTLDAIRFLLGGDVKKGRDVLASTELADDTFSLQLDLAGEPVQVFRSPKEKAKVQIVANTYSIFPTPPTVDEDGTAWFSLKTWSDTLGQLLFGLPPSDQIEPHSNLSNASCLAYFTRRARDGAFMNWVQTHHSQSLSKQAVPLFHLLGLDYSAPLNYVRLDEAKSVATELRKAVQKGFLSDIVGNRSVIRNDLVKSRNKRSRVEQRLSGFNILDFYGEYEQEATELDQLIREAADQNFLDRSLVGRCRRAMADEAEPEEPELQRLYQDAGIVLPDLVRKQFNEVSEFHQAVVRNRRSHLLAEIEAAEERIKERSSNIAGWTERLSHLRGLLSGSIALGDFRKAEREIASLDAEIEDLEKKLDLIDRFDQARTEMKSRKLAAERLLQETLHEQKETVLDAISVFQEISSHIYSKPAEFDIERSENGPRFAIHEPAIASEGINNMQIFTFDLMMSCMAAKMNRWPGFLFHDSHLFDGVDGRQIGLAIEIAQKKLEELGGQYIVTMNSDDYDKAMRESGKNFDHCILDPRLNDSETGGLFGFRFERDLDLSELE